MRFNGYALAEALALMSAIAPAVLSACSSDDTGSPSDSGASGSLEPEPSGVGEACHSNEQCSSNDCDALGQFCTMSCSTNEECGAGHTCLGTGKCAISCTDESDCAAVNRGECHEVTDTHGAPAFACEHVPPKQVGEPCDGDGDCELGLDCRGFCSAPCGVCGDDGCWTDDICTKTTVPSDCFWLPHPPFPLGSSACLPRCSSDADCAIYGDSHCHPVMPVEGSSINDLGCTPVDG